MASLTEVYEGGNGAGLRRLYAGVALFGIGAILLVAGLVVAATGLGQRLGLGLYEARELAGILGGVGLPALLIGTMTVLPRASLGVRIAAAVGAFVCLVGVGLFAYAYPVHWVGGSGDTSMTILVATTYVGGALLSSWCLFAAVANFKARNDPGGTVSIEITRGGETRVVEVEGGESLRNTLGGIGLLGGTPDGEVETQTNTTTHTATGQSGTSGTSAAAGRMRSRSTSGVTDGGATNDDAVFLDDGTTIGDTYCGNCAHFRYVRSDDELVPYCALDEETMDDMDACEEWTST